MIELKNNPAGNFFLLAGPCVIEGEEMAMRIAERVVKITEALQIPYVFKGSYRKANRSRLDSFTGIGDEKALKVLRKVHETFGIPTVTDIHTADEAAMAAEYVDILQIPAFLCRQTDLLVAAAKTGKTINIKKGQFLSPQAMQFAADKVVEVGNKNVMLTERGTTFGYQDLVVDYRGIPEMQSFGYPVILDVTHSLQQPNQTSGVTGGMPQLIEKKSLVPTDKGLAVYAVVRDKKIADVAMTGGWELALSKIATGEMDAPTFHRGIEVFTSQIAKELLEARIDGAESDTACPRCGRPVVFYPKLAKCQNPDCGLTVWRTVARKELTDKQLAELLTKGKTGTIRGFVKNGGGTFDAALTLDDQFKTSFVFEPRDTPRQGKRNKRK